MSESASLIKKVIVITGGTGGIGYQEALILGSDDTKHTIVITGRNKARGDAAVQKLKDQTKNDDIHFAVGDLSKQSEVRALAKDLLARFPQIDELINNAGQLTLTADITANGGKTVEVEGIEKDFAVNVVAPVLLTRLLVPALTKGSVKGRSQITSGGLQGMDDVKMDDLFGVSVGNGIPIYSHTKRVMEMACVALARELSKDGVDVNIVGGGSPGATSMTGTMSCADLPCFMRCCFPCFSCFMSADDGGKSAETCALPCTWAALETPEKLGTGGYYLTGKGSRAVLTKTQAEVANQDKVMQFVDNLIKK